MCILNPINIFRIDASGQGNGKHAVIRSAASNGLQNVDFRRTLPAQHQGTLPNEGKKEKYGGKSKDTPGGAFFRMICLAALPHQRVDSHTDIMGKGSDCFIEMRRRERGPNSRDRPIPRW